MTDDGRQHRIAAERELDQLLPPTEHELKQLYATPPTLSDLDAEFTRACNEWLNETDSYRTVTIRRYRDGTRGVSLANSERHFYFKDPTLSGAKVQALAWMRERKEAR